MVRLLVLVALTSATSACGGGGGFPTDSNADTAPPGGKFSLAWTVTDANSQPITCSQIGGQVISIQLRNRDAQGGQTEAFTCNSLMGTSQTLPPGIYDITFQLTGLAGMLAAAPPQMGVEITSNGTAELAPIAFAVDATGKLELLVTSLQSGGNCPPAAQNGAGITATTITLEHTAGTVCEPVTFQIAAGANQPAGTYVVDCATPAVAGCIENDQKLTVSTLPSDNYRIHIRGRVGATDCWTNDDSLVVPPLSKTLNTTLNLAKLTTPGC